MIFCTVKCADSQNDMIKTLGVYCEKKKRAKREKLSYNNESLL